MKDIIAGILVGIVIVVFLYPYFSNGGIPKSIDELTEEVKNLRKTIAKLEERKEE